MIIPSVFGVILFFYQIDRYMYYGDFKTALDSNMNGVFGLFVSIWATIFVESWKRKQRTIQYIWGCSDKSFSPIDERTQEFKYLSVYNEITDRIVKMEISINKWENYGISLGKFTFLMTVIFSMAFYQNIILTTKGEMDDQGNIITPPTEMDKFNASLYSFLYSMAVIIFGNLYKVLAYIQTDKENYQYQKNYDDALIVRMFLFNGLNFYLPLMFVAFDERNPRNYDDLF